MRDLTTISDRLERFTKSPQPNEALILARFHSDTREYLEAVRFYSQAAKLGPSGSYDYSFEIFSNMANAAWNDIIGFDEVIPSADAILQARPRNANHVIKTASTITRLARKHMRTKEIAIYLQAGLDVTANSEKKSMIDSRHLFMADYTLCITGDTAKALRIKKASMDDGWDNDRDQFFAFSKWCLERKINLVEAKHFARRTIPLVYPGKFRAKIYNTLSDICLAQENRSEAIAMMQLAVQEEPENDYYYELLDKLQNEEKTEP
ncbi:MAG: hypothetical protein GY841_06585 [FCB group bacterium]|nr:hypothetical protein [FCB group bacterium]